MKTMRLRAPCGTALVGWLLLAPGLRAQEAEEAPSAGQSEREEPAESLAAQLPGEPGSETQPAAMPSLIQELPDYSGDWLSRKYLTGDWGGARTKLAESGILFDFGLTQIVQGNAHGGKHTNNAFRYSGSVDFTLRLDTARMKLWPGGLITLRGEHLRAVHHRLRAGHPHASHRGRLHCPARAGTPHRGPHAHDRSMRRAVGQWIPGVGQCDARRTVMNGTHMSYYCGSAEWIKEVE